MEIQAKEEGSLFGTGNDFWADRVNLCVMRGERGEVLDGKGEI